MSTIDLAGKFLPVFLLFLLGFIFRKTGFLSPETASQMKKLAANITLPALLIKAFSSLEVGWGELRLSFLMFSLCCVLLAGSAMFMRLSGRRGDIRGFMFGGFEAGMLGYSLFLTVFGQGALPVFASVDLGQLLFVLLVLISILRGRLKSSDGQSGNTAGFVFKTIVTSPFVWAVVTGLILGWVGRSFNIPKAPFAPIVGFMDILGNLTVPLIALAIGYELNFSRNVLAKSLLFVAVRKAIIIGIIIAVIRFIPAGNLMVRFAFVTMLLLPPPFVVALIAEDDEQGLVSGILSLSTVISIPVIALTLILIGS